MFFEVELVRDVAILAESSDKNEPVSHSKIMMRLLEDLSIEKASLEHGYFMAITRLTSIRKKNVVEETGNMLFRVVFKCRTFLPCIREVLQGVVHGIFRLGVFLRCGPIDHVFLSARKMPRYRYVNSENPFFLRDDLVRIEVGVVVKFVVIAVRCKENGDARRGFKMLASISGNMFGPVALPGADDFDL